MIEETCRFPGCTRLATDSSEITVCAEHREAMDAKMEEDAWALALGILKPWAESAEKISSELAVLMRGAVEEGEAKLNEALDRVEAAEAKL